MNTVYHCVAAGVSLISTATAQQEGPEFVFSVELFLCLRRLFAEYIREAGESKLPVIVKRLFVSLVMNGQLV